MPSGDSLIGYFIPGSMVFMFILFPMMMIMAKKDAKENSTDSKKK